MPPEANPVEGEPEEVFAREEADKLLTEALGTDLDEPEPFVKLLLPLLDCAPPGRLKEAIYVLIEVAFDNSIVRSIRFREYVEAIRRGRNPLEEARRRASSSDISSNDDEKPTRAHGEPSSG